MPLLTLTVFLLCANTPMITVYGRNRGNPCELPSLGSCMPILSILVHSGVARLFHKLHNFRISNPPSGALSTIKLCCSLPLRVRLVDPGGPGVVRMEWLACLRPVMTATENIVLPPNSQAARVRHHKVSGLFTPLSNVDAVTSVGAACIPPRRRHWYTEVCR